MLMMKLMMMLTILNVMLTHYTVLGNPALPLIPGILTQRKEFAFDHRQQPHLRAHRLQDDER